VLDLKSFSAAVKLHIVLSCHLSQQQMTAWRFHRGLVLVNAPLVVLSESVKLNVTSKKMPKKLVESLTEL